MPREADDRNSSVISPPHCEIDKALSGEEEGECKDWGEVRYRGALLCEAHATLLKLQDRARTVLGSVFRMDEWLEENGSSGADEEYLGRIRHEREEALAALRLIRVQLRSARKEALQ